MRIAEGVYEIADLQAAHLSDHLGEQRVRGDVEWHAEKDVGRTLVKLTRQPTLRDVETGTSRGMGVTPSQGDLRHSTR